MSDKESINKFPCQDCITLPICKAIAQQSHEDKTLPFIAKLYDKCSLIREYLSFKHLTKEYASTLESLDILNVEASRCMELQSFFNNKDKVLYEYIDKTPIPNISYDSDNSDIIL